MDTTTFICIVAIIFFLVIAVLILYWVCGLIYSEINRKNTINNAFIALLKFNEKKRMNHEITRAEYDFNKEYLKKIQSKL